MCLAVPGRIEKILPDRQAVVDFMGVSKRVALDLLEGAAPGDYVIVHAGFAISKLERQYAIDTLGYLNRLSTDL